MGLALLMGVTLRPRMHHPRTELDDWMDLVFFVLAVLALIGMIVGGIAAIRARRRTEGVQGAIERARKRYGIKSE
jgi:hypothetical protein